MGWSLMELKGNISVVSPQTMTQPTMLVLLSANLDANDAIGRQSERNCGLLKSDFIMEVMVDPLFCKPVWKEWQTKTENV